MTSRPVSLAIGSLALLSVWGCCYHRPTPFGISPYATSPYGAPPMYNAPYGGYQAAPVYPGGGYAPQMAPSATPDPTPIAPGNSGTPTWRNGPDNGNNAPTFRSGPGTGGSVPRDPANEDPIDFGNPPGANRVFPDNRSSSTPAPFEQSAAATVKAVNVSQSTAATEDPFADVSAAKPAAPAGTMPNPYDYDRQGFTWLRGIATFDRSRNSWVVVYDPQPPQGQAGAVLLGQHADLAAMRDGEVIYVEGTYQSTGVYEPAKVIRLVPKAGP